VTGVRAGLARMTANPAGRLAVAIEAWLELCTEPPRIAAKSRALEAVPPDMLVVRLSVVATVGDEGMSVGVDVPLPP
jgi:hypothetical protein